MRTREVKKKRCPACQRVLPLAQFYGGEGKCKPCVRGHRIIGGCDSTTWTRRQRGEEPPPRSEPSGPDLMAIAQAELFPGRLYTTLTRPEAAAVRHRALQLLADTQQEVVRACC